MSKTLSRRTALAWGPALALLLAACATRPTAPSRLPKLHLAPAELGRSLSLVQRLSVYRLDTPEAAPQTVDVQLEADAGGLRLAGFALGQRILMLQWDGLQLRVQRHLMLPAEVDTDRMLRDLCLVFWPLEALRAHLPTGWTLEADAGQRLLLQEGRTVIRVGIETLGSDGEKIELLNLVEGYRLLIESKPQAT
ncbi:DUF3261 domain-containing protein [Paucibacter sp. Y2R2-4]|uniref:DUF3261 domain-containing protein n=1 Tax=Paucibacter sp. Y2R2-4 TaxID=2893553 RepID=UPI0021E4E9BD|nr:DUF3261 domain-containing protein [Paucibacter sp. Y2R2-4]MCV2350884.1 DUF3261 domain-containing protein [Paucibacter sp. Y2R2-4]